MRILMVNTPSSQTFKGGDTVQMLRTAAALRGRGVSVDVVRDLRPRTSGFDLVHVFNLRTVHETEQQVQWLARSGIPLVMSPIYQNPSLAHWGTTAVGSAFAAGRRKENIEKSIRDVASRSLTFRRSDGTMWTALGENRAQRACDDRQRRILAHVRHLLPNSHSEMADLMRTLRVTWIPFTVVPYGVDASMFLNPDPAPFISRFGIKEFVLQVGRVEPVKNQIMLLYALRDSGMPVVLIGQTAVPRYWTACQRFLPRQFLRIGPLPHELLRSAYAAAWVHALPSWMETCGLVTMEAAMAGANVVVGSAGYECEYFGPLARYCDPGDVESIASAVGDAYACFRQDDGRRRELRRRILLHYSWQVAAERTEAAYRQTLTD